MPIYEYECEKCGHRFDLRKGVTEGDKEVKCPECGTEHSKRVFGSFNSCQGCAPAEELIPRGG
jgi:putative FmdB family regulatory protein